MELKIETNQARPRNKAIIYQAIGWVTGNYQPSEDNPDCGVLVTQDGVAVPAQLKGRLHHQLNKKFPDYSTKLDLLPEDALWTVYPSTKPLSFLLVNINKLESIGSSSPKRKRENQRKVDRFRLVGQIEAVADGRITIVIRRNAQRRKSKKKALKYQPFVLQVVGSLPAEAVGQIWELEIKRQKAKLVLVKGCCVRHSLGKPKLIEPVPQENASRSTEAATDTLSLESKPAIEQSLVQAVVEKEGRTNGQAGDCEVKSELQQTDGTKPMTALANAGSNKTMGKITVFERKARNSFQNKGDREKHKEESSLCTSSQLPSTTLALVQGQQIKPQAASPAQSVPNANHSRSEKTLPHFQKQPQNKPAIREKQPSSMAQTAQALKQPTFSVKVNERVFVGSNSVTLNKRVLCVDGKPVAQGKLAVVVGKPCAMSADGSVTHGKNQTVLMSK
jgi:hypothetical protein